LIAFLALSKVPLEVLDPRTGQTFILTFQEKSQLAFPLDESQ